MSVQKLQHAYHIFNQGNGLLHDATFTVMLGITGHDCSKVARGYLY